MGLLCAQCKKIFPVDHLFEVLYDREGIHFVCSKECSDKWTLTVSAENDLENLQQPSV
jgi:hypothetical protein